MSGDNDNGGGRHARSGEESSLWGWRERVVKGSEAIGNDAASAYAAMAAQAESQPTGSAVADAFREAARLSAMAAEIAGSAYGLIGRENEADLHRAENPRKGSSAVEAKADHSAARRDM